MKEKRVWAKQCGWGILRADFRSLTCHKADREFLPLRHSACALSGDEPTYVNIALNLLSGSGYSMNGVDPTAFRAPGILSSLSSCCSLPGKALSWRELSTSYGSSNSRPCLPARERMFDRTTALIASLVLSIYPVFVGISVS